MGKELEYENDVHIDVSLIPEWTRDNLARATMEYMKRLLAHPQGRKMIEDKKRELGLI